MTKAGGCGIRRAQSVLVYAALIAIIAFVIVAMFKYVHRSVNGKYRQAGDAFGMREQYEPGRTTITE